MRGRGINACGGLVITPIILKKGETNIPNLFHKIFIFGFSQHHPMIKILAFDA